MASFNDTVAQSKNERLAVNLPRKKSEPIINHNHPRPNAELGRFAVAEAEMLQADAQFALADSINHLADQIGRVFDLLSDVLGVETTV